jgi:phage gpG-like protein
MSYRMAIALNPQAAALVAGAPRWPERAVGALCRAIDLENQLTIGWAQARHLSRRGPTTLGVVTNRLRPSLNATPAVAVDGQIVSTIGSNVRYAGVHEFGFVGTVQVKAHTRKVHTYAGGAKLVSHLTKAGKIVKKKAKILSSGVQSVRAHPMKMNVKERSFVRSSLTERESDYGAALSAAVIASVTPPSS